MAINAEKVAEYERKYSTSPLFRKTNASTIAAGAVFNFDFEISQNDAVKYLPFNFLKIINNDTANDLLLYINGDKSPVDLIAASTIAIYDQDSIPAFRSVALSNNGTTTISANKLQILAQRTAINTNKIAQDIHREIFSGKKSQRLI
jgi:hypothetical protein